MAHGSFDGFGRVAPKNMNAITSMELERGNPEMQDRAEVLRLGDRIIVVLADGSGGRSGAAQAAEFFIRSACEAAGSLATAQDCSKPTGGGFNK